jgi:hypothetical protein
MMKNLAGDLECESHIVEEPARAPAHAFQDMLPVVFHDEPTVIGAHDTSCDSRSEMMTPVPARAKSPTRTPARPARSRFTGIKVFWATMFAQRAKLGETVTEWLAAHPEIELVDMVVTQSSDAQFHCVSICVFYKGELAARLSRASEG